MKEKLFLTVACVLLVGGSAMAFDPVQSADAGFGALAPDVINQAFNVSASTVVTLDVPDAPGEAISVWVPIDGVEYLLELEPHSVRAPGYQLLVQIEDGSLVQTKPGIIRTLRGTVEEVPGSIVAGSLLEDGLKVRVVFPDELGSYWIEPLSSQFDGVGANEYVIYNNLDVISGDFRCGNEDGLRQDEHEHDTDDSGQGGARGANDCVTELGIDADFEYFQDHGSSVSATEAQINNVINTVNVQYETEVDITHQITTIIVRTTSADPYSSTNFFTLLTQFRNEWNNNQGGIQRDVAQLFTGKSIDGGVIGVAWDIGVICQTTNAYCLVQSDFNNNFGCATDLSAHELGHLWNADHCSCSNNTMNSFITCSNTFHSTFTRPEIESHRNSRTCIVCDGGGGGPENDLCANASGISNGTTAFTTVGANTDGPTLPGSCEEGFGLTLVNDVWYDYTASCTGTLTVSTCSDASYDTRLAMYDGFGCVGSFAACNDDGEGCAGFTSIMTASVTNGESLKIRVGGFDGSGTGNLTITCDGGGGGDIPCSDVIGTFFQCNGASALKLGAFIASGHSGETVTFEVDGVAQPATTISGQKAFLFLPGQASGNFTLELVDPAGCVPAVVVTCP